MVLFMVASRFSFIKSRMRGVAAAAVVDMIELGESFLYFFRAVFIFSKLKKSEANKLVFGDSCTQRQRLFDFQNVMYVVNMFFAFHGRQIVQERFQRSFLLKKDFFLSALLCLILCKSSSALLSLFLNDTSISSILSVNSA